MFRTVLPFNDSTQAKTHYHTPGMCYMNCTDTANKAQQQSKASAAAVAEGEYAALARSILAYGRKMHQMRRPSSDTHTLTESAAAALTALQSATHMWFDREAHQGGCHPSSARDAWTLSQQQATHGCCVDGYVQHSQHSTTSQNESVNGTTEDDSWAALSDDAHEESMSSMDSADKRKSHILRDLQRLLKRGRSAPTRREERPAGQDDAGDAVSESGVFAVDEYSSMRKKKAEDEEEEQEFKLYRDERDREALLKEVFQQEDEEALIQRIFFCERCGTLTGGNEGSKGSGGR